MESDRKLRTPIVAGIALVTWAVIVALIYVAIDGDLMSGWFLATVIAPIGPAALYVALWRFPSRTVTAPLAIGVVASLASLTLTRILVSTPIDTNPIDPAPNSELKLVAIGDSYMSGEGARSYFPGTDRHGKNSCHRSSTAYPWILAARLRASLVFAACSGAVATDMIPRFKDGILTASPQYPDSPRGVLGSRLQIEELLDNPNADIVLIDIGGNDAGFGEVGQGCVLPTAFDCRASAEVWLDRLDRLVFPAIQDTLTAVRDAAPDAKIFVINYPNPLGPKTCRSIHLGAPELRFLRDSFIPRLDTMVSWAASTLDLEVIDISDVFNGSRLCETDSGSAAVNVLTLGLSDGEKLPCCGLKGIMSLGHGSLHPNALGHRLIADRIQQAILERGTNSVANAAGVPPIPPPNPPTLPPETNPDGDPTGVPIDSKCPIRRVYDRSQLQADSRFHRMAGLKPQSTACYQDYAGEWNTLLVSNDGTAHIPLTFYSTAGHGAVNKVLATYADGKAREVDVTGTVNPGLVEHQSMLVEVAIWCVKLLLLAAALAILVRWLWRIGSWIRRWYKRRGLAIVD